MQKHDYYNPDYDALYPGVGISKEIRLALEGSDRKMEYCEYDLKTERVYANPKTKDFTVRQAREVSLETAFPDGLPEIMDGAPGPEELVLRKDELRRLYVALSKLDPKERELIIDLFFRGKSQTEYGKALGVRQQTISYRVRQICQKTKKLMEKAK